MIEIVPSQTVLGSAKETVAAQQQLLDSHKEGYSALCSNERWLVTAGINAKIKIYSISQNNNVSTLSHSFTIIAHSNPVFSLHLNNDTLFSGDSTQEPLIKVWNLKDNSMIRALKGHSNCISCIAQRSPQLIASSSHDRTVCVWELGANDQKKTVLRHQFPILAVIFGKAEDILYCGGDGCLLSIWNWRKVQRVRYYFSHTNSLLCLLRTQNLTLFSSGGDGVLKEWAFEDKQEFIDETENNNNQSLALGRREFQLSEGELQHWAVMSNEVLLTDSCNNLLRFNSITRTWSKTALNVPYYQSVSGVAWLPDGRVVTCSVAGGVRIWELKQVSTHESNGNQDLGP